MEHGVAYGILMHAHVNGDVVRIASDHKTEQETYVV